MKWRKGKYITVFAKTVSILSSDPNDPDPNEEAVRTLMRRRALAGALRLLRIYALLTPEVGIELSFNKTAVLELIAGAVREAASEVSQNEALRTLVLLVSEQFPPLKRMLDLNGPMPVPPGSP